MNLQILQRSWYFPTYLHGDSIRRGNDAFTPGPGNILALNTVTNYGWKKQRMGQSLFLKAECRRRL